MTKKLILDFTPDYDFLLFAMVSFEKDYKFIWDLNENLLMDFVRTDDYSVYNKKLGEDCYYSSFIYTGHDNYINFRIISNKSDRGLMLEELKGIDFLMLVSGDYQENFENEILRKLKKLKSIQNVFALNPAKLQTREKLINALS